MGSGSGRLLRSGAGHQIPGSAKAAAPLVVRSGRTRISRAKGSWGVFKKMGANDEGTKKKYSGKPRNFDRTAERGKRGGPVLLYGADDGGQEGGPDAVREGGAEAVGPELAEEEPEPLREDAADTPAEGNTALRREGAGGCPPPLGMSVEKRLRPKKNSENNAKA